MFRICNNNHRLLSTFVPAASRSAPTDSGLAKPKPTLDGVPPPPPPPPPCAAPLPPGGPAFPPPPGAPPVPQTSGMLFGAGLGGKLFGAPPPPPLSAGGPPPPRGPVPMDGAVTGMNLGLAGVPPPARSSFFTSKQSFGAPSLPLSLSSGISELQGVAAPVSRTTRGLLPQQVQQSQQVYHASTYVQQNSSLCDFYTITAHIIQKLLVILWHLKMHCMHWWPDII